MQPSIGAIHNIDVAALVRFDIVRLDRNLAPFLTAGIHATLVGCSGDSRDEVADFLGMIWIANIKRPHACVEKGDKGELFVVDRRYALIGGMGAETPAPLAERTARLRHCVA